MPIKNILLIIFNKNSNGIKKILLAFLFALMTCHVAYKIANKNFINDFKMK
jgi:hypothetical protein